MHESLPIYDVVTDTVFNSGQIVRYNVCRVVRFAASSGALPVLGLFRHAAERHRSLRAMLDTPGGEVFWTQSHATLCAAIESSLAAPAARRAPLAVPATIQAQFVAGALLGVLTWWLREGMPYPPEQVAAMVESLLPLTSQRGTAGT